MSSRLCCYDDRLEIWNPGGLIHGLHLDDLLKFHRSIPRNVLISDAFFYSGLIENWGTGTIRIVSLLTAAGMPPAEFSSNGLDLKVMFHKDLLTHEQLKKMGLSERQIRAVAFTKEHGKISNSQYQELTSVSKPTASRELREMKSKGILKSIGTRGAGSTYKIMGSIGSE